VIRLLLKGLGWLLALLALAAVLTAAAGWIYAQRALPITSGAVRLGTTLDAPKAELRIERDASGIPTIKAASVDDAMWGLGWSHAQDRLWQLETHRRIGAGRLAEAFGEGALESDRFIRALGVRQAAERQWETLSAEGRAALEAYAAGINAWIAQGMSARPPEFLILGIKPEPWTPVDSLAWQIMMAWDLGGNWNLELLRMRAALRMPADRVEQLLPPYPGDERPPVADYAALYRDLGVASEGAPLLARASEPGWILEPGVEGAGSNNWVVHGSRSSSGAPLLANDPHLKLTTPALWYFARLEAPGFKVAGATMPALPVVVLGQNAHIAWGWTNTGPDVQDLYLERLKPDDANQVQTPDGWAPMTTRTEVIRVRGQPDVTMTARATRHGPVISDAGTMNDLLGIPAPGGAPRYAIAMRWTALDAGDTTIDATLAFNRARSVDEFIRASAQFVAPMQNMVVADQLGHIGFVAAGRIPVRAAEHDLKGLVPAPGWEARYDWTGFLDPRLTPRQVDPPGGTIATANQRIHGTDYPHHLTSDWTLPYRHQRIEELLAAAPKHTLESLRAIQADEVSLAARKVLPWAREARSSHPLADAARQQLLAFDGTMSADRAAPLILWAWTRQLTLGLLADDLGQPLMQRALGFAGFRDAVEGILERKDGAWCDDKTTPAITETCDQQINTAMTRALEELSARYGRDVARWRWGDAHVARAEHRPFSRVPPLNLLFEQRTPTGGDTYTVNVSRVGLRADRTTGELYLNEHAASLRALYDVADPSRSLFMHSSGQSGIPWSPHYRDFLQPWATVQFRPVWGDGGPPAAGLTITPP
jgi:penicillin G amidase